MVTFYWAVFGVVAICYLIFVTCRTLRNERYWVLDTFWLINTLVVVVAGSVLLHQMFSTLTVSAGSVLLYQMFLQVVLQHPLFSTLTVSAGSVLLHQLVSVQAEAWEVPARRHRSRSLHSYNLCLRMAEKGQTVIF